MSGPSAPARDRCIEARDPRRLTECCTATRPRARPRTEACWPRSVGALLVSAAVALGRHGHTGDPLYGIRRVARTQLLSARQCDRLTSVLDADEHSGQGGARDLSEDHRLAYADPDRRRGKRALAAVIDSIRRGMPAGLEEIAQLGRTLWRRREDILAFFDHHASTDPPKPSSADWKPCARNALGFRNPTHYRLRSLLHSGALHALVNAL